MSDQFEMPKLSPDIAASLLRLLVGGRFRDEETDTRLVITLQAYTGVLDMPKFERLSRRERQTYYSSSRDHELSQGCGVERRFAMFLEELGAALHEWCDDEEKNRALILKEEQDAERKRKEKEKAKKAKLKEKAKKAGQPSEDDAEDDDEEDYFEGEEE